MTATKTDVVAIQNEADIVQARQTVRKWATELTFSLVDQTKLVTAASELARNTLTYGGGGQMRLEALSDGFRKGLRLTFEDKGPGIPDIQLAMQDGYTSGSGLGYGLGGAKRLVNDFQINSKVGEGTTVSVARWK